VTTGPILLRRPGRRFFRRLVFVGALAGMLLAAPSASGVPGDPTPPEITPLTFQGALGANGWYRSTVTIGWEVNDPESIILEATGCGQSTVSADTVGIQFRCTAKSDGGESSKARTIKLDVTPPAASVVPERQPDANGWYNHPFTVGWTGTDLTSGVAGCTTTQYAGPDNVNAFAAGSCTDHAGNTAGSSFGFKYDATPPAIFAVSTRPGNRSVELSWRASSDTQAIEVLRAPGKNRQGETIIHRGSARGFRDTGLAVGRSYEYRVRGFDAAANRAEHALKIVATGALLSPTPRARVSIKALQRIVWIRVKKASYYNLQLVRGRRVLSTWPVHPGFRLRRTWTYRGRRYSLRPGVYRWYVWPGKGRISAGNYGRLLGSSTFVVTK
jgi:hypothetical protein